MRNFIIMFLLFNFSFSYERFQPVFDRPVVDPEPPGVNPVEPFSPFKDDCSRPIVVEKNCDFKTNSLKAEIERLKRELSFLRNKRLQEKSCLFELKELMVHVKVLEKKETIKLDGSIFSYDKLIGKGLINHAPKFYSNIRYDFGKTPRCILIK
ncbi:MAG: hypothetical protein COB02_11895 [Candidatus Cloacimonadota bacterium]|nr:MAG: hypothetical protein COB02_11895 [Candidatus Cloacimonadota bacterium]